MKKQLFLTATLLISYAAHSQNTFPTSGNAGIGTTSPTYKLDVVGGFGADGIRITRGIQGSAALHLNNTTSSGNCAGKNWSMISSGCGDESWLGSSGNFAIVKNAMSFGAPSFMINGTTGNIVMNGGASNLNPTASLHIGDGAGNLHTGTTGVLMKFAQGDRALLEMHSPNGSNRLVIQSLSGASYITSVDDKPLFLNTSPTGGGVSIGSDAAFQKLNVNGNMLIGKDFNPYGVGVGNIMLLTDGAMPTYFRRGLEINPTGGEFNFYTYGGPNDAAFNFKERFSGANLFRILVNGQVKIGTDTQVGGSYSNAMLTVGGNGIIVGKEVVVTQQNWADFVFSPNYKLPKLQDVESYYLKNKHLPGIPSENDVLEKGVSLGEMNKILLQKIEELTIYVVALQKQLDEQKK